MAQQGAAHLRPGRKDKTGCERGWECARPRRTLLALRSLNVLSLYAGKLIPVRIFPRQEDRLKKQRRPLVFEFSTRFCLKSQRSDIVLHWDFFPFLYLGRFSYSILSIYPTVISMDCCSPELPSVLWRTVRIVLGEERGDQGLPNQCLPCADPSPNDKCYWTV